MIFRTFLWSESILFSPDLDLLAFTASILFFFGGEQDSCSDGVIIWPKAKTFSCNALIAFFSELEKLSEYHTEPELFDHFFNNKGKVHYKLQ